MDEKDPTKGLRVMRGVIFGDHIHFYGRSTELACGGGGDPAGLRSKPHDDEIEVESRCD